VICYGDGLEQLWALDDAAGTTASNAVPGGNAGTLVNFSVGGWDTDVPAPLTGRAQGSLLFTAANTNYVNGGHLGLAVTNAGDRLSLSFWLKPSVIGGDTRLFSMLRQTSATPHPLGAMRLINEPSGQGTLQIANGGNPAWVSLTAAGAIRTNLWQHVCLVWQDTLVTAYLNGVPALWTVSKFEFDRDAAGDLIQFGIGAKYLTYGTTYDGKMADLSVWDETLSPMKVRRLASGESPLSVQFADERTKAPLYWTFDDGAGSLATNSAPGGNTGTLVNFAGNGWDADVPAVLAARSAGSLAFDRLAGQYVNGSHLGIESVTNGGAATVSVWVKTPSIVADMRLFSAIRQNANTPHPSSAIRFLPSSGSYGIGHLECWYPATGIWTNSTRRNAITTNQWHHLGLVWNKDKLTTYLNGEPESVWPTIFQHDLDVANQPISLGIGAKYMVPGNSWGVTYDGKMDEFAVWDEPLTADRIRQLVRGVSPLEIAPSVAPTAPERALVEYRFDGNALDRRGGHHGSPLGGVSYAGDAGDTPFAYTGNKSLRLNGIDGQIVIPDAPELRPGTNAWTISLWFKAANADQKGWLIGNRKNAAPYSQMGFLLGDATSGSPGVGKKVHTFVIGNTISTDRWEVTTRDDVADGNWHHVAMVREPNAFRPLLYVDGYPAAITYQTDVGPRPHNVNGTDPWRIGSSAATGTYFYNGLIDEVAMWKDALPGEQILWLAQNSLTSVFEKGTLIGIR